MKAKSGILVTLAGAAGLVAALGVGVAGGDPTVAAHLAAADPPLTVTAHPENPSASEEFEPQAGEWMAQASDMTFEQVREFGAYEVFGVGERFAGLNLTAILRTDGAIEQPSGFTPVELDYITLIYGACDPAGSDTGCSPPLQIQSWRSCDRTLSDYPRDAHFIRATNLKQRGVPAAEFDGGRIELYTGTSTIVLFGASDELLQAATNALRQENGNGGANGSDLPPPAPGALEGALVC